MQKIVICWNCGERLETEEEVVVVCPYCLMATKIND